MVMCNWRINTADKFICAKVSFAGSIGGQMPVALEFLQSFRLRIRRLRASPESQLLIPRASMMISESNSSYMEIVMTQNNFAIESIENCQIGIFAKWNARVPTRGLPSNLLMNFLRKCWIKLWSLVMTHYVDFDADNVFWIFYWNVSEWLLVL